MFERESTLDIRYNIAALAIAILREDICIPEQAFAVVSGQEFKFDQEDIKDMMILKKEGMTYQEIGDSYGINKGNVYGKIRRVKKKPVKKGQFV